jgi:PEP-CTERM motif
LNLGHVVNIVSSLNTGVFVMKKMIACALVLAASVAQSAHAATYLINFTVSGQWFSGNGGVPYGVPNQQSQSGSVVLDDSLSGVASVLSLNYVTGSRTWTLADLQTGTQSLFSGGAVTQFDLLFGPSNYVYSNNTAQIGEPIAGGLVRYTYCNDCVSFRPGVGAVPEPETWAMMIGGLGFTGLALRRRRRVAVVWS